MAIKAQKIWRTNFQKLIKKDASRSLTKTDDSITIQHTYKATRRFIRWLTERNEIRQIENKMRISDDRDEKIAAYLAGIALLEAIWKILRQLGLSLGDSQSSLKKRIDWLLDPVLHILAWQFVNFLKNRSNIRLIDLSTRWFILSLSDFRKYQTNSRDKTRILHFSCKMISPPDTPSFQYHLLFLNKLRRDVKLLYKAKNAFYFAFYTVYGNVWMFRALYIHVFKLMYFRPFMSNASAKSCHLTAEK